MAGNKRYGDVIRKSGDFEEWEDIEAPGLTNRSKHAYEVFMQVIIRKVEEDESVVFPQPVQKKVDSGGFR